MTREELNAILQKEGNYKAFEYKGYKCRILRMGKEYLLNIGCFIFVDMFSLRRRIDATARSMIQFPILYTEVLLIVATGSIISLKNDGELGLIVPTPAIFRYHTNSTLSWALQSIGQWTMWRRNWSVLWIRFWLIVDNSDFYLLL